MKKSILLSLLAVFTCINAFAQELKTAKSLSQALENARKTNKPVLLIVDFDQSVIKRPNNNPERSEIKINSALNEKAVIDKINDNLVVYKTKMNDTSIASILKLGRIKIYPSYIFINQFKDIIYKDFENSSSIKKYVTMVDSALLAFKEQPLSELQKEYELDKTNNTVIRKIIGQRKRAGIINNAMFIEQYAKNLKIDDFNDYQTVLYILEAGPYADETAYKLAHTNRKIIDSIYKTEPYQKRVAINSAIIANTMNEAAKTKNTQKALAGAGFARGTYTRDYLLGNKNYFMQMLWYYNNIKDTANYIKDAIYYYDNYYMNVSADSIKKIEDKNRESMRQKDIMAPHKKMVSKEKLDSLIHTPSAKKVLTSSIIVGTPVNTYANELNTAAWKFYETGTKNINYLSKAMIWSRRSIELNPRSAYYDTLAHILYRMGYFEEAIKTQEDAIKKSGAEGMDTEKFQIELKKMKSRSI